MKKLFFLLAILFCLASCKQKTETENKNNEITQQINDMTYGQIVTIDSNRYFYLLDRLKEAESRIGHGEVKVFFGNDEFILKALDEKYNNYRYVLKGEKFDVYVQTKSVFKGKFEIMKVWSPIQDKYNIPSNLWTIISDFLTSFMNDCSQHKVTIILVFFTGFFWGFVITKTYSSKDTTKK
jgi:hypothetical protein